VGTSLTPSSRSVFRAGSYSRFWLARVCSSLSYQMIGVAVGWQMYGLTHSTFALGMVGLVQFLPLLLLNLVVGHVADRVSRKSILAVCQAVQSLIAVSLGVATLFRVLHPEGLFCAVALIGVARAFESPSTQALSPTLVEESLIPQAIAWSSSANQTASILGPALGGLFFFAGAQTPYLTSAALFLCASALSSTIRPWRQAPQNSAPTASSIFLGIHYIRNHKRILGAISLDLFAVLLGGATALLPAFTRDILHTGPWGLGLLRLSPALGALTMSVVLAHWPIKHHAGTRMFAAVIVFGLATVAFALSRSLWLSMFILAVLGSADVVSVVVRSSLVQLETPDEMRGRVSAVNSLFIGTSNQLGEFESGVTASFMGLIPATIFGGAGSVAIAILWMCFFPDLRKLDQLGKD
jgi:MFS family permease